MALVYSTDHGRTCPACRRAVADCVCRQTQQPAGDGNVRVARETGGRGGKVVTLVHGLPLTGDALAACAKTLRSACGTGGTVKAGVLELQGEHRDRVVALLQAQGYKVKRVGG